MKKRDLTALVLLVLFVPIFAVEIFYPLFLVVIFLLAGIAAFEMTRILGNEKMSLLPQVLTIVLTILLMIDTALFIGEGLYLDKYGGLNTHLFMIFLFPLIILLYYF